MGSACADTTQVATLEGNLLSHFHMTSLMWYHDYLSNFSVSRGVEYVLGETNSISVRIPPESLSPYFSSLHRYPPGYD